MCEWRDVRLGVGLCFGLGVVGSVREGRLGVGKVVGPRGASVWA